MEEGTKGWIQCVAEVEVNFSKPFTIEDFNELVHKLDKMPRGKHQYFLSRWEAENCSLDYLNWLGKTYDVIVGLEVHNIVREREKKKQTNK